MVIVVTSDQHLGYSNSDSKAFADFLDELTKDATVTDLVLLGDVVDMWRRDASGVFLESRDIFEKICALDAGVRVHYVAGNHDFHVLQLQDHSYPFEFVRNLRLEEGGRAYRFLHGYEFDPLQTEPLMEALCRVMSDGGGDFETGVWATLTRDWSDLEYFLSTLTTKRRIRRITEELQRKPEERLQFTFEAVEKRACASASPGETLVFGHTHRPFMNKSGTVVNSGSWVKDSPIYDTYVRLDADGPRLFVFGGEEITERVEC